MVYKIFADFPALKHIVTERDAQRGCSFSMALHTGEDTLLVRENRRRLESYFGERYRFCGVRQTHSDQIHTVTRQENSGWERLSDAVEADALITNLPGVVLTILTADCVPILLYDPVQGAVGAVHAGWRGTAMRILSKTITRMTDQYDSRPEDIHIAIGPAIGQCCYEVDQEVAAHFMHYTDGGIHGQVEGKYQLDLKHINQLQALEAGILSEHIEVSPLCTSCAQERFFSYRAEQGCSGRFASAISLRREGD